MIKIGDIIPPKTSVPPGTLLQFGDMVLLALSIDKKVESSHEGQPLQIISCSDIYMGTRHFGSDYIYALHGTSYPYVVLYVPKQPLEVGSEVTEEDLSRIPTGAIYRNIKHYIYTRMTGGGGRGMHGIQHSDHSHRYGPWTILYLPDGSDES